MPTEKPKISVVSCRARDLEAGDVITVRVYGTEQWVELTDVGPATRGHLTVKFKGGNLDLEQDLQFAQYQLVRCQIVKET